MFSKRDVATVTEPISRVPDRWGGPHRDHTSSDEEMDLIEKERHRNVQEETGKTRRGGKHNNRSHRCIFHVLSIAVYSAGTPKLMWLYLWKHKNNNVHLRDFCKV